jgi:hypothetical protein
LQTFTIGLHGIFAQCRAFGNAKKGAAPVRRLTGPLWGRVIIDGGQRSTQAQT